MRKKMNLKRQRNHSIEALTYKMAKGANRMDKAVIYCRVYTKRQTEEGDGLARKRLAAVNLHAIGIWR